MIFWRRCIYKEILLEFDQKMTLYNDTNLFNATLNDSDPRHINYTKNNEDEYVVNINQLTILYVLFESLLNQF